MNDFNKTNNVLEGWNRSLNSNIYQPNPSIYEIGNVLKNQHAIVENKISKIFIEMIKGNVSDTKKVLNNEKNIILKYDDYCELDFLKAIGFSLNLKEL